MSPLPISAKRSSGLLARTLLCAAVLLAACSTQPTPALFVAPTAEPQVARPLPAAATALPTPRPTLTATAVLTTPTPCSNGLHFDRDVTIEDGTTVLAGQRIDKQWLVTNSGTCNWDSSYRLKLMSGDAMGAAPEQALYPARAGAQATIRIIFTAPQSTGGYQNQWQAFAPDGSPFGDPFSLHINVGP